MSDPASSVAGALGPSSSSSSASPRTQARTTFRTAEDHATSQLTPPVPTFYPAYAGFQTQNVQYDAAGRALGPVGFNVPPNAAVAVQAPQYSAAMQAPQFSGSGGGATSTGGSSGSDFSPSAMHASRNDRRASSIAPCGSCGEVSGNTVVIYKSTPSARTWPGVCVIGPDWPCLCVTYALIVIPSLVFLSYIAIALHPGVVAGGVVLFLAAVLSLSVTALSDPGYLPKNTPAQLWEQRRVAEEEGRAERMTLCQYCNVLREQHTSHCFECNACVLHLDHQ